MATGPFPNSGIYMAEGAKVGRRVEGTRAIRALPEKDGFHADSEQWYYSCADSKGPPTDRHGSHDSKPVDG